MPSKELRHFEMATPGSPKHAKLITASKVPIILGLSPWQTKWELWMEMSGLAQPDKLTGDHLDWGHYAEGYLLDWWRDKNPDRPGWQLSSQWRKNGIHTREVAYTDTDLGFPNQATLDCRAFNRRAKKGEVKHHIVECKTSNSHTTWKGDGLPAHIQAQVLAQMGISGIHTHDTVAQVGSTVPRIIPTVWDQQIWDGVVDVLREFHASLGEHEPPEPPQDLIDELLATKSAEHEPDGGEVEWAPGALDRLHELQHMLEVEKQHLIAQAGTAKRVLIDGKAVMTRNPGRFAASRLPKEAKHLAKDPDVLATTTRLDAKKFAQKYPALAEIATAEPTYRFL